MSNNPSDWKTRERTTRARLQSLAVHRSNSSYTDLIFEELHAWDETIAGRQSVYMNPPIRTTEFFSRTRMVLLQHFIRSLSRAIIQQDAFHFTSLDQILSDNYESRIRDWPIVDLRQNVVDVTGFRNTRVDGGDGMDFRYYYFAEWYTREYGKDAVRRESQQEPE